MKQLENKNCDSMVSILFPTVMHTVSKEIMRDKFIIEDMLLTLKTQVIFIVSMISRKKTTKQNL